MLELSRPCHWTYQLLAAHPDQSGQPSAAAEHSQAAWILLLLLGGALESDARHEDCVLLQLRKPRLQPPPQETPQELGLPKRLPDASLAPALQGGMVPAREPCGSSSTPRRQHAKAAKAGLWTNHNLLLQHEVSPLLMQALQLELHHCLSHEASVSSPGD